MPWPSLTDYSTAVQSPSSCFTDPELRLSEVATSARGLPLSWTGKYATVYRLHDSAHSWAVRCITREIPQLQDRYRSLSAYLALHRPASFVAYEYLPAGINIKGQTYPIIKMPWLQGATLDRFLQNNSHNGPAVQSLAVAWIDTIRDLRTHGIAHNDLQHGNVIVQGETPNFHIRLVDYDSTFIPPFNGLPSPELGHSNYQHPRRSPRDYAIDVDNFPATVIYLSLLAVAHDPHLWESFHNQDNLILTKEDFLSPQSSKLLQQLTRVSDPAIAGLASTLRLHTSAPVLHVPDLLSTARGLPNPRPARVSAASPPHTPPSQRSPATQTGSAYRDLLSQRHAAVPERAMPATAGAGPTAHTQSPFHPAGAAPRANPAPRAGLPAHGRRQNQPPTPVYHTPAIQNAAYNAAQRASAYSAAAFAITYSAAHATLALTRFFASRIRAALSYRPPPAARSVITLSLAILIIAAAAATPFFIFAAAPDDPMSRPAPTIAPQSFLVIPPTSTPVYHVPNNILATYGHTPLALATQDLDSETDYIVAGCVHEALIHLPKQYLPLGMSPPDGNYVVVQIQPDHPALIPSCLQITARPQGTIQLAHCAEQTPDNCVSNSEDPSISRPEYRLFQAVHQPQIITR